MIGFCSFKAWITRQSSWAKSGVEYLRSGLLDNRTPARNSLDIDVAARDQLWREVVKQVSGVARAAFAPIALISGANNKIIWTFQPTDAWNHLQLWMAWGFEDRRPRQTLPLFSIDSH